MHTTVRFEPRNLPLIPLLCALLGSSACQSGTGLGGAGARSAADAGVAGDTGLARLGNCSPGYSQRGGTCADIDECKASGACDPLTVCTNLPGTYRCSACPEGSADVHGDGRLCRSALCPADQPDCDTVLSLSLRHRHEAAGEQTRSLLQLDRRDPDVFVALGGGDVPASKVAALIEASAGGSEVEALRYCPAHARGQAWDVVVEFLRGRRIVLHARSECPGVLPWNVIEGGRIRAIRDPALPAALGELLSAAGLAQTAPLTSLADADRFDSAVEGPSTAPELPESARHQGLLALYDILPFAWSAPGRALFGIEARLFDAGPTEIRGARLKLAGAASATDCLVSAGPPRLVAGKVHQTPATALTRDAQLSVICELAASADLPPAVGQLEVDLRDGNARWTSRGELSAPWGELPAWIEGCPPGYDGDPKRPEGCTDRDECAAGLHTCDFRAGCQNTPGGFRCGSCPADTIDKHADGTLCEDAVTTLASETTELQAQLVQDLQQRVAKDAIETQADLLKRYKTNFTALSYDPSKAINLDLIQKSELALNDAELTAYKRQGFVVTDRVSYPSFAYGYEQIYVLDLPVFVSADAILYALHRSYDALLKDLEENALIPALVRLLEGMRGKLREGGPAGFDAAVRRDIDLFTAVPLSLLQGKLVAPVAGASLADIERLYLKALAASGVDEITLFGVPREVDFSQFKPRGHYTDSRALELYFRAMMWLGRIDLRMIETLPNHSQVFRRRQLVAALGLRALVEGAERTAWQQIDATVRAFVGEADYMTLEHVDRLVADLKLGGPAELAAQSDAVLVRALREGGYGEQKIMSHIMTNGLNEGTLALNASFALLGQRYVVDSHVFANVVFDRAGGGAIKRMMPSPLDVAFAALGNDQAAALLGGELETYPYAPDLHATRTVVDQMDAGTWQSNLYNLWLSALRTLSPGAAPAPAASVFRTEAWGRRLLNTQLASWAELRHDTILYAKQSYTGSAGCEYPDAYVEPNAPFFGRIVAFAERARELFNRLPLADEHLHAAVGDYLQKLHRAVTTLEAIAKRQETGAVLTAEQLTFVNTAVRVAGGSGPSYVDGWYADLFYDRSAIELDPTIADVHTQPTDEAGNSVGRVLHVATGRPRLMVLAVETCKGPRAYAGVVSSYFEKITENFERLDDPAWEVEIREGHPADVAWLRDLVVR